MKKNLEILNGIFISLLLVGLQVFTFYMYSQIGIKYSKPHVYFICGIFIFISYLVFRLFRKRNYLSITQFSLTTLITVSLLIILITRGNFNSQKDLWESQSDSYSLDFVVGEGGYLYLNAEVNEEKGLFLFDTGVGISTISEEIPLKNHERGRFLTLTDSKKIQQRKRTVRIDSFMLGPIIIKNLEMYPLDSIFLSDSNSPFNMQDSTLGVIGSDIISKYIWDFNMVDKKVTVSRSRGYSKDIPDSYRVDLIHSNTTWYVPVKVNDIEKKLTLDFGCSSPLKINDTIPLKNKFNIKGVTYKNQDNFSAFSHLEPNYKSESQISFVDVSLGNNDFFQVKCNEGSESALFGIPFVWAFERVVLDLKDDKAYFISKRDSAEDFGVNEISKRSREFVLAMVLNTNGKAEVTLRNEYKMPVNWISSQNDTLSGEYKLYGNIVFYGGKKDPQIENYTIDSIACIDSLMLPNGAIKYGQYLIDFNKNYFHE